MAYIGLSQHIDFVHLPSPDVRFELKHLIGEGTYGEVFAAYDKIAKKTVAVKILETIADNLEEIEEEFLVLRDLSRQENLPEFYGMFLKKGKKKEEDQLWFALQLCTGGSITDLVHELRMRGSRLSDNTIAYILRETVKALVYLHQNHCMHRDVKGHNILLTEEGNVKLVDFGVCSHLAATLARRNTSVGTPYWMSPEVIACEQQLDQSYDARCDVWSLGITAIELAEGDPPLSELHPMRALFQIPRNPPPNLVHQENFSPLLSDFISQCLVKDFEQRPFARELLEHQFLRNVDEKKAKQAICMEIERQRGTQRGFVRKIEVTTKYGKLKSDRKSKPTKMYIDDLAALEALSESVIVEQLKMRYEENQIYTYIGDILLACNPFEKLNLYAVHFQQKYSGKARSENPPHIFAVADASLQALVHEKQNQAIVISGESGSGKTESANFLLKQLVFLGKAPNRNLEEKILQVNPIMESFGNARTGINSNSSRFGKYLELLMTKGGKVTGARISVYLLEQSRVIRQSENEGNFHIFYYFYDGMEEENRLQDYYLDPSYKCQHKYLRHLSKSMKTNQEKWKQLKMSFKVVGFIESEIDSIYRILAAILNLGDIEFGEAISNDNTDNKATVIDIAPLLRVSKLLGVEKIDLLEALTSNSVVTRGETIVKNNTVQEAISTRDAMAKALYGRLFDWMVNHINTLLVSNQQLNTHQLSVGLLDVFGFENHQKNSFEQLMINIANEQIQYYFNQKIFSWEQQEYISEGIPIDLVEFSDNRPILDMLLSRPLGLLALLDEESRFPKSSDETLVEKFHGNIKTKFYQRPKSNALCFAVHHYAGRVVYNADGFLEKNKNFLPPEIIQLIRGSQHDVIRFLFQCPITRTGNLYSALLDTNVPKNEIIPKNDTKEKFNSRGLASQSRAAQSAATYFRYSLMDLLQKMIAGTPQFVRCIKPNDLKIKKNFEEPKVVKQLRYTGVLETIRIRQNGFSHRLLFSDFLKKYCFLAYGFRERVISSRDSCRILLVRLKMDGYALGKSKVFLKYYHVEHLAKLHEEHIRKIVLVQAFVRRWLAKVYANKLRCDKHKSALTLQKHVRGWLTRRKLKLLRQAKESVDKQTREEENMRHAALLKRLELQKHHKNESENRAALVIQTCFRNHSLKIKITPDMEEKIKLIVSMAENRYAAHKMLKKEGYKEEDIVGILEKYCRREDNRKRENLQLSPSRYSNNSNNVSPYRKPISVKERQMELVQFAQDIHIRNQEIHKNLRQNKIGIPLNHIERLPPDYHRPPGFSLIPSLLGNFPRNEHHILNLIKANSKQYYASDKSSNNHDFDVDFIPWDYLLHQRDNKSSNVHKRNGGFKEIVVNRGNEINSNWYNVLAAESANQRMRPMEECLHNVGAFNYLKPSPTQLSLISKSSDGSKKSLQEFQEEQRKMQIKFINDKNKEKKSKKPKSKRELAILKEDIILNHKSQQRNNENTQNIKTRCGIHNGVYINNFDKIKNNEKSYSDKFSNISTSSTPTKEINYTDHENRHNMSSKSSMSSNRSNMSIERSIIKSGLMNFASTTTSSSSHLGPFNFRLLLKPTEHLPPTESLRKRKIIFTSSPHIPDKNIKF